MVKNPVEKYSLSENREIGIAICVGIVLGGILIAFFNLNGVFDFVVSVIRCFVPF